MIRKRGRRREGDVHTPPPPTTSDAVEAIHATNRQLSEARSLWPRINRVSSTLSRELEENDFAGRFRVALGGPEA